MKAYLFLAVAIAFEIAGTTLLNQSDQFKKLLPGTISILCYIVSLVCLSVALKNIPVGIAYAIWSGLGVFFISLIGWFYFQQKIDTPAIIGLTLIVIGVLVINLFSKTAVH